MRISDWSSDVCSSDLHDLRGFAAQIPLHLLGNRINPGDRDQFRFEAAAEDAGAGFAARAGDRPATQRAVDVDTAIGDDFGARADGGADDQIAVGDIDLLPRTHRVTDDAGRHAARRGRCRSEEHTSELQSLMRISYAVFCLKNKKETEKNK